MQLCQIIIFLLYILIVLLIIECGFHIRSHKLQYPRSIVDLGFWTIPQFFVQSGKTWSPGPIMIEGRACKFSPRAGGEACFLDLTFLPHHLSLHLRLGQALFTKFPTEEQKARYNGGKTFKQNPVFRSEPSEIRYNKEYYQN